VALTLDAELVALGPNGRRTIAARDFFLSHFTTALEPDELLLEVAFPVRAAGAGWEFLEFSRKSGDFAVAAVAVDLGRRSVGVAGIGDRPWRSQRAEQALAAGDLGPDVIEQAASGIGEEAAALAEDTYRGHLVAVLTRRALATAQTRNGSSS
jgi:carbon-monoxide dehydrogenase medium subunit